MNTTVKPASAKQLRYLRALAQRTGTTFAPPSSSREASREITRMRGLAPSAEPPTEREEPERYATAPVEQEIAGYGIDAHWRHTRPNKRQDGPRRASIPAEPQTRSRRVQASVLATHQQDGAARQVLSIPVGSTRLIVDRLAAGGDARLLARLGPDEPAENAALIARMYINDPRRPPCRRVSPDDLRTSGATGDSSDATAETSPAINTSDRTITTSTITTATTNGITNTKANRTTTTKTKTTTNTSTNGHEQQPDASWRTPLLAGIGATFQIEAVTDGAFAALRWTERRIAAQAPCDPVPLRRVIGALEDYQPAIAMSQNALRAHHSNEVSLVTLKNELARLLASPTVLNRRLRERVQQATEHDGVTMSLIAIRCGRVKHDPNGRQSGETSWLARRIGLAPEAGAPRPTPWVHTDVLALIARDGLGIAPAEAELH